MEITGKVKQTRQRSIVCPKQGTHLNINSVHITQWQLKSSPIDTIETNLESIMARAFVSAMGGGCRLIDSNQA